MVTTPAIGTVDPETGSKEPPLANPEAGKPAGAISTLDIENALRFSPYVKEAVILADRRRFVSALIQIDFESVSKWAEEQGLVTEAVPAERLLPRWSGTAGQACPLALRIDALH